VCRRLGGQLGALRELDPAHATGRAARAAGPKRGR